MGLFDKLKGFNETDTEAAKRLYDKATSEYKAKNYYSAVRLYEMAWDKDPDVGNILQPQLLLLLRMGHFQGRKALL